MDAVQDAYICTYILKEKHPHSGVGVDLDSTQGCVVRVSVAKTKKSGRGHGIRAIEYFSTEVDPLYTEDRG